MVFIELFANKLKQESKIQEQESTASWIAKFAWGLAAPTQT